ncbi:MAG: rhamnulokinase [Bacteroidaceae bacterium]|nr:rhamnulokinase [Bacteroidaceae bacterium]
MLHFLAVDLGATSGRTVLATFDDQRIQMREFTRFENPQLPLGGHIFWNLPHLYNEILRALRQVKAEGIELQSIGIDTWGCDFAFFGRDGQLLGLPHCYRDPHTDGAMERYFADRLPQQEVYERTGIQLMPFNSLFQLDTLRRNGCVALQEADKVLFMPDALIYMLTGQAVCEYTVASTSQMLNPRTGDLDEALLKTVGLERRHFGRLVQPGERVGTLTAQVQEATGLGAIPVVAVGSHDTASAVAAVPAQDDRFAYLSCGTWSLLGVESPTPIINPDSFAENFTNEGGLDHTTRFLKNITGLWIYEQCRKEWTPAAPAAFATPGRVGGVLAASAPSAPSVPSDVNQLNALCLASTCQSIINPDDPRFAHPTSMTAAIREYLTETRQPLPETPADYVRVIFRSLAARYQEIVRILRRLTPVDIQRLHVIGGGSRNQFLMQFTADALQLPVVAGPQEGTALGNALVQVRAAGLVGSLPEMRAIITRSIELKTYLPQ